MTALLLATGISDSINASMHGILPAGMVTLVDAAARALVVAGIVAIGLRLLAGTHVPAQKTAWGLVLVGALLIPVVGPWARNAAWVPQGFTWVVPAHTVNKFLPAAASHPQPAVASPASRLATYPESTVPAKCDRHVLAAGSTSGSGPASRFPAPSVSWNQPGAADTPAPPSGLHYFLPLSDLVWLIYGSVCLALLLRLAYGLGGAIGLWQSAQRVDIDPALADGLLLRSSRKITSPVTVGSAVVLPDDYDQWDTEKLRIVLAHERAHVRQGDFYLQALAALYTALFWFSPLGWWLKRKLSDLGETISDHAGLEEAASHASYARILLEFAALPRRAQVGVAMARPGGLSQRIERLLNESTFRQAFTGGRSRLLAAFVLVPVVLFAATTLIRVQAAQIVQHPLDPHRLIVAASSAQGASTAILANGPDSFLIAQAPQVPPPADPGPAQAPAVAPPAPAGPPAPQAAPAPPPPASDPDEEDQVTLTNCNGRSASVASHSSSRRGYSYSYSDNGDSYALVTGKDQYAHFSGDMHTSEIDKARAMAHGDFLWFNRDGKSYVISDPQIVAQVQSMYKPMEELGRKQRELGDQQRALGDQQRELGRRQREASIPTPDISKEMADLNATIAKLQSQAGGTMTEQQLGELQRKIGQLQGKLGRIDGQIGRQQGELGRQQGDLGRQQGELGRQQGELGREQGRLAREADSKVHSIIDQSLKDGKAKPVQ